ncbi:MAG: lanthionine synthetase LanC family protein, partial [Helcococcus sp.]|nr:lanthionine synthetase LanC family protein [Helcococcus sp.]
KNIAKELSEIDNLNMMNNSICHGYAGVILILNKLYRKTGIKALKEKSDKMYYQVLESMDSSKYIFTEKDIYFRGEIFDEEVEYVDYSLLSGNVGIVLSLLNHKYNIDSLIGRMLFI